MKIWEAIRHPSKVVYAYGIRGGFRFLSDEAYLKLMYRCHTGKKLNLEAPQRFNEKIQWLKLHDRKPEYTMMVDKYEVKKYVAEKIGEEYVIPTLGVWNCFEEIDFDALPNQFVLKCTHDSGGLVIVKDKAKLDKDAAKQKLEKSLKRNYFYSGREWPYKNVKPRIIAEKYMEDKGAEELSDYKLMCFGGVPKLMQIHHGRFQEHTQDFYDMEWNKLDILQGLPMSEENMERPVFLDRMMELSRKLSENIPQVRVDWYYANNQLFFGELTFFDASGFDDFEPDEINEMLGSWVNL